MMKKLVHVQSVLPYEDVIVLKEKSGESSVKEAISKAVYHYLKGSEYTRKIYLVKRNDDTIDYDETHGFVAIADSIEEAREMGINVGGDQNPGVWALSTTSVSVIGYTDRPKGIIMRDYHAA